MRNAAIGLGLCGCICVFIVGCAPAGSPTTANEDPSSTTEPQPADEQQATEEQTSGTIGTAMPGIELARKPKGLDGGSVDGGTGPTDGATPAPDLGGGSPADLGGTPAQDAGPPPVCVDTTSDPNHCGACGHSCGGGACVASKCQPVVLGQLDTADFPWKLAVSATDLYVTTSNSHLWRVPKAGGTAVATTVGPSPRHMAIVGNDVYVAGSNGTYSTGSIYRYNAVSRTASLAIGGLVGSTSVASDGTYLFYNDYLGQAMYRVPLSNLGASPTAFFAPKYSHALIPGNGKIYFAHAHSWQLPAAPSTTYHSGAYQVSEHASATPQVSPLEPFAYTAGAMAAYAESVTIAGPYLYWITDSAYSTQNYVARVPINGGATEQVAREQRSPGTQMTSDANYVYWVSGNVLDQHELKRAPVSGRLLYGNDGSVSGSMEITVLANLGYATGVVSDNQFLYWVDKATKQAKRLAK